VQNGKVAPPHRNIHELGVKLGADRTARENGSVGGQMVKRIFEQFGNK